MFWLAEAQSPLLRYQRDALQAGEWWRLWSGHWVHLGSSHLLLNLLGLGLIWALVGRAMSVWAWLLFVSMLAPAISLSLYSWLPSLQWYVGLSGMLHGLLLIGALLLWWRGQAEAILLLLLLLAKLAWELWQGNEQAMDDLIGARVISEAHLYGAACAAIYAAVMFAWQRCCCRINGKKR